MEAKDAQVDVQIANPDWRNMKMTVWALEFKPGEMAVFNLPKRPEILGVDMKGGRIVVMLGCDQTEHEERVFCSAPIGSVIPFGHIGQIGGMVLADGRSTPLLVFMGSHDLLTSLRDQAQAGFTDLTTPGQPAQTDESPADVSSGASVGGKEGVGG